MDAQIEEIGDGIFRFSLYVPEIAPPAGFTFNHFLIRADEPLLFHCGKRKMFASLASAVAKVLPLSIGCAGLRSGISKPTNAAP